MAKVIATRFEDSFCVRCGEHIPKGTKCNYARPFGVWHLDRCIPEFPEPTGALRQVVVKLVTLESEGRLKGYTQGLLDRYRLLGVLSDAQIATMRSAQDYVELEHEEEPEPSGEKCPCGLGWNNCAGMACLDG
jgi:hypothetical protein